MNRVITVLLLLFSYVHALGQGEANNWYFGSNAGITFNGGNPTALTNGSLATSEGCATISDSDGNLVFYTDGSFVWNRNHGQMPSGFGMMGNSSAAQSAIIVPKPGDDQHYYIFTVDAQGGANGFRYSEVDMDLAGGLGDVVTASKNTLLFSPSVEKVTAVKHANGIYVWVIAHGLSNNRYYAYLVDCNGVNSPIITDVGQVEGAPGWGCLTSSPNGLRLAAAMRVQGFEVLDFDPATGVISNPILLSSPGSAYGIAFSPNSDLLYGLRINGGQIYQWDLQAGGAAAIVASIQQIGTGAGTGNNYLGGAIQQGPDDKLYIPHFQQPFLSAINNPNTIGAGCDLQYNAVNLQGRNAILGLPPFIQSYFDTVAVINYNPGTCQGNPTDFSIGNSVNFLDSVAWNFGDPTSGLLNTSSSLNPIHVYELPGTYQVELVRYLDCISDTATELLVIQPYPVFNQTEEICGDETYTLPSGLVVSTAGIYHDTIPDGLGCDSVVITDLIVHPLPVLNITSDTSICAGATLQLSAVGADNIVWNPPTDLNNQNISTPVYSGSSTQSYTVTGTNITGCMSSEILIITVNPLPVVNAGLDDSMCDEQTVQFSAIGALDYSWSPVSGLTDPLISSPIFNGNTTTTFTVTGTDANGCEDTDDLEITVFPIPVADFLQPADVCLGNATVFSDNSSGNALVYSWNFGDGSPLDASSNPSHTYGSDGTFPIDLDVTDVNGCQASASSTAVVFPLPNAAMNLFDGQEFCENEEIQFENQSTGGSLNLFWNFGDNDFLPAFPNTTSTLSNPTMAYNNFAFGPYTVFLFVTDAAGCMDETQTTIIIHDNPSANFASNIVCEGNETQFTDESSVFVSNIDTWNWYFGDGNGTSTSQNPFYLYGDSGTFSVQLSVETDDGCSAFFNQEVLVNPTPEISISGIDTCLNNETAFQNNSSPQNNTIDSWIWDFGDGTLFNGFDAAYTYADYGDFIVTLSAVTDSGCSASGTSNISIFPNPEPAFNLMEAEGCTPHEVLFVNQSTLATGFLSSYTWGFGDGASSANTNPIYTYQDSGYYDITLSATSAEGCTTIITVDEAVRSNITPNAVFSIVEDKLSLLDADVEFIDESEHGLLWDWNLGDGTLSSAQHPVHTYTQPGLYDVILTVTNDDCQDVAFGQVQVNPIVTFYIPSAFTPDGNGINETFFGTGESIAEYNMKILDRWGMQLFESNEPGFHWDGTFKGKQVESGVYVYQFYMLDLFGYEHRYNGHVTLLR
ncbi:PKD domain-containing protein [Flavobacteriales bacterium]|nr:PKD domain-containing protein [Flavobacteriales bacterium]